MRQERRYAATVLTGAAAAALAVAIDAYGTVVVAVTALYAGTAYYTTAHPDVVWGGDQRRPDWASGALGGGLSLGMLGLVGADATPGVLLLAFGLASFGFVTGVSYGRVDAT